MSRVRYRLRQCHTHTFPVPCVEVLEPLGLQFTGGGTVPIKGAGESVVKRFHGVSYLHATSRALRWIDKNGGLFK